MNDRETLPRPARTDKPLARPLWVAINAAERLICGDGAVRSRSVTEGLALAGRRAARALESAEESVRSGIPVEAAWVDHRVREERHGPARTYAFELIASDGQEAIDQCLVAHRLADRLARPGLCTVDRDLASRTEVVWLPESDPTSMRPEPGTSSDGEATPDVLEAARAAFTRVAGATGRPIEPAAAFALEDARHVLLAAGSCGSLARETAVALRGAGVPCGALVVGLLRPFDADLLRGKLAGAETISVLAAGPDDGVAEFLVREAESAFSTDRKRILVVNTRGCDVAQVCRDLKPAIGSDVEIPAEEPVPAREPIVVGGWPADTGLETLLLDSVSWLTWLDQPTLDLQAGAPGGVARVTVGARHDDDRPLDLLFITRSPAAGGTAPLAQVRETGTLMLRASTEDAATTWALLTPEQRAVVIRRRLRVVLIAPECDSAAGLQGAILDAIDRDVVERLRRAVSVTYADDLAALAGGVRAMVSVDPSTLAEPDDDVASEWSAPRLPAARTPEDVEPLRRRVRSFHFTGRDPDAEPPWSSSLRPLLLTEALAPDSGEPEPARPTLFEHWSTTVLEDRRARRAELHGETETLSGRLRETLGLAPRHGDTALKSRLGTVGSDFLDTEALQATLSERHDASDLPDDRRQRLTDTLDRLENSSERLAGRPVAYAFDCGRDAGLEFPRDVKVLRHSDGLRAALGLFDGLALEAVELARALRLARLELTGNYSAAKHGPMLDRLDFQSLTKEEILCLPAVVVLESARHLRGPALAAFSELIRAGRPVQVLIAENIANLNAEAIESANGYHPGLGYLAVAHREALVVQSSIGRPEHLDAGLQLAASSLGPVVVITAESSNALPANGREQLETAVRARATPCFVYNPGGGATWAERFALDGNPQPDRAWPSYAVTCSDKDGAEQTLEQAFTFAHAAALDPCWRSHFLVVGPEAWLDDQFEIDEYLDRTDRERAKSVPFLWVVEDGTAARALISWELARVCQDHARAWRILQELAGTDNAYALRAAEEARRVALEEAEHRTAEMETDFALALTAARGDGASSAVDRLVRLLADPNGFDAATFMSAAAAPSVPTAVSSAPAAVAEAEVDSGPAVAAAEGPYIDSFLCTTCNDCTNLNPQLFRYNANKQAEIADPAAGTYKQLVKAAEACPARCIHPGPPRKDDKTATPALMARAAKFG